MAEGLRILGEISSVPDLWPVHYHQIADLFARSFTCLLNLRTTGSEPMRR